MLKNQYLIKIDQQQKTILKLISENSSLIKENNRLLELVNAYDNEHDENQKWINSLIFTIKIQKSIIKKLKQNKEEHA